MEAAVHFPGMSWLDGTSPEHLLRQTPILLLGIAIYIGTWYWAYTSAAKHFEQVDL